MIVRKNYLCLSVFCPEPGGKVLAKSIGYNPVWEKNAPSSWARDPFSAPPVEDRLIVKLKLNTKDGNESELSVEINPWGAYRVERDGNSVPKITILAASSINREGWSSEIGIPLDDSNYDKSNSLIKISIEQVRSRRPKFPEFRWKLNKHEEYIEFNLPVETGTQQKVSDPIFSPPLLGNKETELHIGYVQTVPNIDIGWDDPFWQKIQGIFLPKNEPNPRKQD